MEEMSMTTIFILATIIAIFIFSWVAWENNKIKDRQSRERIAKINAKKKTVIRVGGKMKKQGPRRSNFDQKFLN